MKRHAIPQTATMTAALEQWFATQRTPLYHYLTRLVGDAESAADLLQETAMQALRSWQGKDPPDAGRLTGWIYAVASNRARDHLRRQRRWRWLPLLDQPAPAPGEPALLTAQRVRQCLAQLPARDAEALLLHLYAGWRCAEIAARSGDSEDAVRMRIARARRRFQKLYAPEGEPDVMS
ncbi:MAG TPA: sigma-70 family RNA polymerase sigma factor [Herpetosiphonaceae bacterium]